MPGICCESPLFPITIAAKLILGTGQQVDFITDCFSAKLGKFLFYSWFKFYNNYGLVEADRLEIMDAICKSNALELQSYFLKLTFGGGNMITGLDYY